MGCGRAIPRGALDHGLVVQFSLKGLGMPRSEGFLDPGAGPLASFAWDLRVLREKAGKVPYRVLANRAGFCASSLSVAASGAKLPSLDVTLAYVQACGGDPETWRTRWQTLAAQHASAAPSSPDAQPELHVAPPYDADAYDEYRAHDGQEEHDERDEDDEPSQLDAVTLRPPPDSSRFAHGSQRGHRRLGVPIRRV